MSYSDPLIFQLHRLLLFLGVGFLLGFVWTAFGLLRELFANGKRITVFLDVLFCAVSFLALFFSSLAYANGRIRLHLLFAAALGYAAYHFTLGRPLKGLLSLLARIVRRAASALLRPFQALSAVLCRGINKLKAALAGGWKRWETNRAAIRERIRKKEPKKMKKRKNPS